MNTKTTLPPDWKPAAFNPDFKASAEFENQITSLERLRGTINVLADLSTPHGENFQRADVTFNRVDLMEMFLMLNEGLSITIKRNELMYKHVCNMWGGERLQAERELRGEA